MLNRRGRARRRALSWSVIAALALSAVAVQRAPEAVADDPGDPGLLDWCADTAPGDTGYLSGLIPQECRFAADVSSR